MKYTERYSLRESVNETVIIETHVNYIIYIYIYIK